MLYDLTTNTVEERAYPGTFAVRYYTGSKYHDGVGVSTVDEEGDASWHTSPPSNEDNVAEWVFTRNEDEEDNYLFRLTQVVEGMYAGEYTETYEIDVTTYDGKVSVRVDEPGGRVLQFDVDAPESRAGVKSGDEDREFIIRFGTQKWHGEYLGSNGWSDKQRDAIRYPTREKAKQDCKGHARIVSVPKKR